MAVGPEISTRYVSTVPFATFKVRSPFAKATPHPPKKSGVVPLKLLSAEVGVCVILTVIPVPAASFIVIVTS
jgi:hypothetical protein